MRTNIVMLAVLAGFGLSSFGAVSAEAENLSCISGISPGEQRLLRDCEPKPGRRRSSTCSRCSTRRRHPHRRP